MLQPLPVSDIAIIQRLGWKVISNKHIRRRWKAGTFWRLLEKINFTAAILTRESQSGMPLDCEFYDRTGKSSRGS